MRWWCGIAVGIVLFMPGVARAGLQLPPGFSAHVYVTGEGFVSNTSGGERGIPAISTLTFDHAGALYMARTGRFVPGLGRRRT